MNKKRIAQISVDAAMSILMLIQMSYSLAGKLFHEISGIALLALFISHHILSLNMAKSLLKGKKTPEKAIKLTADILLCIVFTATIISAISISQYIFGFLEIKGLSSIGRTIHMLGAYWGFALVGIHIGFHLDIMLRKAIKNRKNKPAIIIILSIISLAGLYFFISEGYYNNMLLLNKFAFIDNKGGLPYFIFKYLMIGAMFVSIGYLLIKILKRKRNDNKRA